MDQQRQGPHRFISGIDREGYFEQLTQVEEAVAGDAEQIVGCEIAVTAYAEQAFASRSEAAVVIDKAEVGETRYFLPGVFIGAPGVTAEKAVGLHEIVVPLLKGRVVFPSLTAVFVEIPELVEQH